MANNFSDYIVYADESGDHSLTHIDKEYPIFCLVLCLIKKEDYINVIVPNFQQLKFDYWGHDKIILHERDIRKGKKDFSVFTESEKNIFLNRISGIVRKSPFYIISTVIDKRKLIDNHIATAEIDNPYDIALTLCMENLINLLMSLNQTRKMIHCIFESRGANEDTALEKTFKEIISNENKRSNKKINFKMIEFKAKFATKPYNLTGIQLADLIARPIGKKVLNPNENNKAYDIIKEKYPINFTNKTFLL